MGWRSKMTGMLRAIGAVMMFGAALIFGISALVWTPVYGVPALVVLVSLPGVLIARRRSWKASVSLGALASVATVLLLIGFTFSLY